MKKNNEKKLFLNKFKICKVSKKASSIYGGTGDTDGTETTIMENRTSTDPDCNDTY